MKTFDELRDEISTVDAQMARLFCNRMEASKQIAFFKKENNIPILDKKREEELVSINLRQIEDEALRKYYERFLRYNIKLSREYQEELIGPKGNSR